MKDKKIISLIIKLDERAVEGELDWEKTAIEDEFQTILSTFIVRICHQTFRDGESYKLTIINAVTGAEIETITDEELDRAFQLNGETLRAEHVMLSIFKNAKRKALGVDKAVDDILSALDGNSPHKL